MTARVAIPLLALGVCIGCGTSKWTDSRRSATEQLLVTDAMDRAVSRLDFRALAGKTVFIDDAPVKSLSDAEYLVSCMRQHMLASGCIIKGNKEEADYVTEIRAGAVGTDRHELLYGVPAVNIPTVVPVSGFGIPSQIPEIPFVKKTDQRAVAKIAIFAYNRKTGRPIWQSGTVPMESNAKAIWVFGAGPFQRGTIYDGMSFAGDKLNIPLIDLDSKNDQAGVSVADEAYFIEPDEAVKTELANESAKPPEEPPPPPAAAVVQASHAEKGEPAPAKATEDSGAEEKSKDAQDDKTAPGNAEAPAALPTAEKSSAPTSPVDVCKADDRGRPTGDRKNRASVGSPAIIGNAGSNNAENPAAADPFQDGTAKDAGTNEQPDRPTTLAYPPGMFAPDHRRTVNR